jgi:hypothetical protein
VSQAVRTAGGNDEFQQSTELLKKKEMNLIKASVGLSKMKRGVLGERGGI